MATAVTSASNDEGSAQVAKSGQIVGRAQGELRDLLWLAHGTSHASEVPGPSSWTKGVVSS